MTLQVLPINRFNGMSAVEITPDDDNDLAQPGATLWIGTGGDLMVDMVAGGTVTFKNIADGTVMPIQVKKVYTASTCSDIVAMY